MAKRRREELGINLQLGTMVRAQPFQPFDIRTADGDTIHVFHPDFIKGTSLGRHMHEYSFFSYEVNESLHMSENERKTILDCFEKIGTELQHAIDKHTKKLVISNLELLLNYAVRFYDRQFVTREVANKGVHQTCLARADQTQKSPFNSRNQYRHGQN